VSRLGVRSRLVADAFGAPVLRDQGSDRPAGHGKADILVHEARWRSADRQDTYLMLNNREWAILIWGVGVFLVLMARKEIRSSVGQLLRTLLSPQLLIPLLVMFGYIVGEVWLGYKARLWRSDLIKDTIVWFVISALAFFFGYDQASKQPHFFRRRLVAAVSIPVFLEFFANLFVLNLIAELALQPFLILPGLVMPWLKAVSAFES
jgi:hypothetical protein